MKRLTIAVVLSIIVNLLSAQITISTTDMPAVNDTVRISETNDIQGLSPELTGTNFS